MIQIFTPIKQITENQLINREDPNPAVLDEPSKTTIQNILNFSRNLDVKPSKLVGFIELIQS